MRTLANTLGCALVLSAACATALAATCVRAPAQTTLPGRTLLEQRVLSSLNDLNLTGEQRAQIEAALREERQSLVTLLVRLIATQDELRAATREGRFDEAQVRSIVTGLTPALVELIVVKERALAKIYNVLTDEQRALLDRKRAELSERFTTLSGSAPAGGTLLQTAGAQLALSPVQQLAVMIIVGSEYPRIEALVGSLSDSQAQVRAATEGGRFDEAQVRAIATGQAQAAVELAVVAQRTVSRLYTVLGPEQRAKIENLLDEAAARLRGLLDSASIDDARFFVRQHYVDFLSREPEREGFGAWVAVLDRCGGDAQCLTAARTEVSSAFFRSQEFQLKGYFVYRFYRAAFGRMPRFAEIMPDMRSVTGQTSEEVHRRRAAFADAWVGRAEFRALYGGLSNAAFVDKLLSTAGALTARRGEFVAALDSGQKTRAQVVRDVVESEELFAREYNGAFVAMQYFGYLRRDPEAKGYSDWLNHLNQHPADYQMMVWGFVASAEYRGRFGN
jgi:Spy/CpxP family protein refolding chaperone